MSEINTVRVTESNLASSIKTQLSDLSRKQFKLQKDVASGQHIHEPSDDPNAVGQLMREQSNRRDINKYEENVGRALSILHVSADAIEKINGTLEIAQDLASMVNNDLGKDAFPIAAVQSNQLLEQIVALANTKHLKSYLFAGTKNDSPPFEVTRDGAGKITAVSYIGNTDTAEFHISDTVKVTPFAGGTTTTDILSSINDLLSLRDAADAQDPGLVLIAQKSLITSSNKVINSVTELGSKMIQVETVEMQNQFSAFTIEKNISRIASTDFVQALADLSQLRASFEAATTIYARIFQGTNLLDHLR